VARDAVQPRQRVVAAEPAAVLERGRERLGEQVNGGVRVGGTAREERQQRPRMLVVEVRDGVRVEAHQVIGTRAPNPVTRA
jgi:hypothetical protein